MSFKELRKWLPQVETKLKLVALLMEGGHTYTELANKLNIGYAVVSKDCRYLQSVGFEIEKDKNLGYQIVKVPEEYHWLQRYIELSPFMERT